MTRDYILILGSNHAPARHLRLAARRLRERFEIVACVPAIRTRDADGTRYLNAAVRIRSALSPEFLRRALREIESEAGRVRGTATVTLDIDLVAAIAGDGALQALKQDDLQRSYVRTLLDRLLG